MTVRTAGIVAWTTFAFIVAIIFGAYLFINVDADYAYFIVVAGFLIAALGIYKEKA